jgi:hypothetical protein
VSLDNMWLLNMDRLLLLMTMMMNYGMLLIHWLLHLLYRHSLLNLRSLRLLILDWRLLDMLHWHVLLGMLLWVSLNMHSL